MKAHYRVIIVGGGVVGASVLYHLTKKGWRDVALIERLELTSGSTWHAAGGMHTINGDPNVAKLQQYTINLYKEIEEISGLSCGLHMTAGLMLVSTKPRWEWLKSVRAKGRYMGMQAEEISLDEAVRLMPLMDKSQFYGALFDPVQGHVDPNGTTYAYAGAAKKGGAEIFTQTRVTATHRLPTGEWRVETEKGTVTCEHLVNCGGLWAREVGRMVGLELPVLAMEHQYLLTEDMPEVIAHNEASGEEVYHVVDFDGEIYMRQERKGMLVGTYERDGVPWSPKQTPWDFGPTLLPDAMERMAENLEIGFRHFPALERAGIRKIINGPFTFAPDGNPLVGPVQGLTNYWVACGVMAGFSQGGGVGLALSNWMVDGDPGADIWAMDVARYGDWASRGYTNKKVVENYGRRFRIKFPNEELPAGRPLRTTPLHHKWLELGAVMGDYWAMELPLWFAPPGVTDEFSFHRSNDFAHVAAECAGVRDGVGITETSTFAKYEITGPGAEAWLSHLLANRVPKAGRMVLTPMLNHAGKLIGDFTLAKAADETFYLFGSGSAEKYHMRWFEAHLPKEGGVSVKPLGLGLAGLSIAGPKSRDLLAKLVDEDVTNAAFRFMDFRARMEIGMVEAMVGRITYTGDLGYEFWVKPEHQVALFDALMEAGAEFGIKPFGTRAMMSLAREKNFGSWSRDFRPIYSPFEAGLERFVDMGKNDFLGRAALAEEKAAGPKLARVAFTIDATDADCLGDEPVWLDGEVIGWITSGGYCHHAGQSFATGYVPRANAETSGRWEIEILGERRPATLASAPLFDPNGARMRG